MAPLRHGPRLVAHSPLTIIYHCRNFLVVTPSEEYDEAADAFVRPFMDRFQAVMGFDTLHVYVNEALGDEGPASWYGEENLPRLVALKQQWDPENKFGAGAPIPLSL
jgi:FAD/FMN-containing dehydrogenase